MAMDPAALLAQVESAIEALLNGGHSQYSIGSRSVTKLDLPQLFSERRLLLNEVQRSQSGGTVRLAKFMRTSQ